MDDGLNALWIKEVPVKVEMLCDRSGAACETAPSTRAVKKKRFVIDSIAANSKQQNNTNMRSKRSLIRNPARG
jgi:hypothetical protein